LSAIKIVEYAKALSDLEKGRFEPFTNKIVVVGTLAPARDRGVGIDGPMTGVMFVAQMISSIENRDSLRMRRWGILSNFGWSLFLAILSACVFMGASPWRALAGVSVSICLALGGPAAAFSVSSVSIDTVGPLLSVALAAGLSLAFEAFRMRRISSLQTPPKSLQEATVMFVDLVDSTPLVELIGCEKALRILNAWMESLAQIVKPFGGEIYNHIGDGLLVLFPAGGKENHAVRAVRAAQACVQLANQMEHPETPKSYVFRPTIGIESGMLSAGELRVRDKREVNVAGETVHRAARLQAACKKKKVAVLTGPVAYGLAHEAVSMKAAGTVNLKGLGPTKVFTLQ
jgi:class 3 adenylate cyclase